MLRKTAHDTSLDLAAMDKKLSAGLVDNNKVKTYKTHIIK